MGQMISGVADCSLKLGKCVLNHCPNKNKIYRILASHLKHFKLRQTYESTWRKLSLFPFFTACEARHVFEHTHSVKSAMNRAKKLWAVDGKMLKASTVEIVYFPYTEQACECAESAIHLPTHSNDTKNRPRFSRFRGFCKNTFRVYACARVYGAHVCVPFTYHSIQRR